MFLFQRTLIATMTRVQRHQALSKASRKKQTNKPYGVEQSLFIEKRRALAWQFKHEFFKKNTWSWVEPKRTRDVSRIATANHSLHTDSFHVKDVAVWVPHLIMPSFVPSCPKCDSNVCVQVNASVGLDWVKRSKILYG